MTWRTRERGGGKLSLPRTRWRERQTLQADDLQAEQDYKIDLRRRHNLSHHGWGVVRGLTLVPTVSGVSVEPGLGSDGYGREVLLPARLELSADLLRKALGELVGSDVDRPVLALWILYGCRPGTEGESGSAVNGKHRRSHEECRLRLTSHVAVDPRRPPGVPDDELGQRTHLPSIRDPALEWPVYLGAIEAAPGDSKEFLIDLSLRPLVTLTGTEVRDPGGRAKVRIADPKGRQPFEVALRKSDGEMVERLCLDRRANATLRGSCRAGVVTAPSVVLGSPSGPLTPPGAGRIDRSVDEEGGREQLRITLGHPSEAEEPASSRLCIGPSNAPSLRVDADRKTWVANLKVRGRVRQGPIPADPGDPRFASAITEGWLNTLAATVASKAARDPDTIRLDLLVPEFVTEGEPVPFTVTLRNPGTTRLEDCRVFLTLYPSSGDHKREVYPKRFSKDQPMIHLDPDQWLPFQGESDPVTGAGLVLLRIEAVAFVPSGDSVRGLAEAQVKVFSAQGAPSIP